MDAPMIVVVEDDPTLLTVLQEALADEGYQTLLLPRAAGSLTAIRQAAPALVILDLWLEEPRAGWHLLEQFCADPITRHIPLIVTSADSRFLGEKAARLAELGCHVLAKPFDLDALLRTVARYQKTAESPDEGGPRVVRA
jgi:CheY-like chemotaxis protein